MIKQIACKAVGGVKILIPNGSQNIKPKRIFQAYTIFMCCLTQLDNSLVMQTPDPATQGHMYNKYSVIYLIRQSTVLCGTG